MCTHIQLEVYVLPQVKAGNPQEAIAHLKKAHEMAKESMPSEMLTDQYTIHTIHAYIPTGRDSYQEGLACYRLGNAHNSIGDNETAIQVCLL